MLTYVSVVLILVLDGLIKPTAPGSLIEPAKTYMFPTNWLTLPLSFGLLMSPWYVDSRTAGYNTYNTSS